MGFEHGVSVEIE
jgi:hypothetical protein